MTLARRLGAAALALLLCTACTGGDGTAPQPSPAFRPSAEASPTAGDMRPPAVGVKVDQQGTGYLDVAVYEYSGLDVEVARVLSEELFGVRTPVFIPVSSDTRESALTEEAIRFFVSTYSMTPQRGRDFNLAGPYLVTRQGVMVRAGGTAITNLNDLDGKTVCVVGGGSLSERVLKDNVPGARPTALGSYSDCLRNLQSGKYDAFSTDQAILYGYAATNPELAVVPDLFVGEEIFYGVAFSRSDRELCERARDVLIEMVSAGGDWPAIFRSNLPKYAEAHPNDLTRIRPSDDQIESNSCKADP
jgi:glutamate transport system substrate-binding protein